MPDAQSVTLEALRRFPAAQILSASSTADSIDEIVLSIVLPSLALEMMLLIDVGPPRNAGPPSAPTSVELQRTVGKLTELWVCGREQALGSDGCRRFLC